MGARPQRPRESRHRRAAATARHRQANGHPCLSRWPASWQPTCRRCQAASARGLPPCV